MKSLFVSGVLLVFVAGCMKGISPGVEKQKNPENNDMISNFSGSVETATFAGGRFWYLEEAFEKTQGIISAVSGFSGGMKKESRHSVQVEYDPEVISYAELLDLYWRIIDPADAEGSFSDRGMQYTSAIYYHDDDQKELAEESKKRLNKSGRFEKPAAAVITEFISFRRAPEDQQDYYRKNPEFYNKSKKESGREDYILKIWGTADDEKYNKPSMPLLKAQLTEQQYCVTQENATERAFNNEFWNNHQEGIYVDVVSGEPLFSSKDKFNSGTGWPSFTKPIDPRFIVKKLDESHGMERVEVRSKNGDSHLGHLFNDGPQPTGIRYCMNSSALRFIPKEKMKEEGYEKYLWMLD